MAGSLPQSGVALVAQNAGQFISQMSGAEKALGQFGKGAGAMSNIVTGAFREVGAIVTRMAADAIRAVGQWVGESISVAGDFEQTLNVLGATSGATAAELAQVGQKAKELGADMTLPATSAQDAAEVMLELSKAGLTVQESMDAAKGALQLSAAAQVDAATAASITAGALNAFGLEASEAVRVADLLAAGANASSASMTDLSAGLQQAGFAFNAAGLPVEDLVTSLAALTNVGLTGSDAGTALKNALMRLMDPTDKAAKLMAKLGFSAYDAQGNMKPLPTLITDLNAALAGMTQEERNAALGNIFLSDGMKAMIPLLDLGTDGFLALKDQVTEAGAAATVANAQMQGWNGAVAATSSQLETLQLSVGTLLKDALTPLLFKVAELIPKITAFVDRIGPLAREVVNSEEPFRKLLFALQVLIPPLGSTMRLALLLYNNLKPVAQALAESSAKGEGLAGVLTVLLTPLGATQGAIALAVDAVNRIRDAFSRVAQIVIGEFSGSLSGAQGALAGVINFVLSQVLPTIATFAEWLATNLPTAIAGAKGAISTLTGAFTAAQPIVMAALSAVQSTVQSVFGVIQTYIPAVMASVQAVIGAALTQITAFWNTHGAQIMAFAQTTWTTISSIISGATEIVLAVVTGAFQAVADFINAHGTEIQLIFSAAWEVISNVVTASLALIQGAVQAALAILRGDWQGAWQAVVTMSETFTSSISGIIDGFLNMIAGFFGTSLAGINATWAQNWDSMVSLLMSIPGRVASVGGAIVKAIASGFASAWNSFMADVKAKLASMRDMLPFSEPHDKSSPLYGLPKSGKAIVQMLQKGIDSAPPLSLGAAPLGSVAAKQPPQMAGSSTNTSYGATYNMPVYTNQSPAVLSQGLALIEAVGR